MAIATSRPRALPRSTRKIMKIPGQRIARNVVANATQLPAGTAGFPAALAKVEPANVQISKAKVAIDHSLQQSKFDFTLTHKGRLIGISGNERAVKISAFFPRKVDSDKIDGYFDEWSSYSTDLLPDAEVQKFTLEYGDPSAAKYATMLKDFIYQCYKNVDLDGKVTQRKLVTSFEERLRKETAAEKVRFFGGNYRISPLERILGSSLAELRDEFYHFQSKVNFYITESENKELIIGVMGFVRPQKLHPDDKQVLIDILQQQKKRLDEEIAEERQNDYFSALNEAYKALAGISGEAYTPDLQRDL